MKLVIIMDNNNGFGVLVGIVVVSIGILIGFCIFQSCRREQHETPPHLRIDVPGIRIDRR